MSCQPCEERQAKLLGLAAPHGRLLALFLAVALAAAWITPHLVNRA